MDTWMPEIFSSFFIMCMHETILHSTYIISIRLFFFKGSNKHALIVKTIRAETETCSLHSILL
jgi:hypothetical protein